MKISIQRAGFNIGTFQIGGAETSCADNEAKYDHNLNVGIQMYERTVGKPIDRNSLTAGDRDVLAHVGYIQSERNPAYGNLFAELGNGNLSDSQVVRLMSTKIQDGIDAIGQDVVSMMRNQPVNLNAVNARSNEPVALRRQPAVATIQEGYVGPQVQTLQRALNQAGGYNLNPDRQFGSQTAAAVMDFQQKNGLSTALDIARFTRNRAEVPTNIFDSNYDRQATRELAQSIKQLYPNATILY